MFLLGRRSALACAALAVALGVTGCGGGGSKPVSLPSISASDSPTPTATSADPATAASNVVRQYFAYKAQLSRAMRSEPLASIETKDCVCHKFIASISTTAAQGNRYFGTAARVRSLTPSVDSLSQVEVLVEYDTPAGGTMSAQGRILFKGPKRTGIQSLFTVRLIDGRWLIADITNIKPGRTG